MTQEEKRIKIAEACGWIHIKAEVDWLPQELTGHFTKPHPTDPEKTKFYCSRHKVPDYFSDLNACHNMEKSLCSIDHWIRFEKYLAELGTKFIWHATAAQRAEAFGLTLGLWK